MNHCGECWFFRWQFAEINNVYNPDWVVRCSKKSLFAEKVKARDIACELWEPVKII